MNNLILSLMLMVSLFYLSGCVDSETKTSASRHPDAEEVLRLDENANIFQWEGLIYKTDIDWVNELELSKKELVGAITELFTNQDTKSFKNGMANKLPIGTKIYSTNESEGIFIVEYKGEEKYYLSLVEG
ncbi:hypothetical protein BGM26_04725 [Bacillus sp. FJAT-29790]|uniref:hypothetical protein n=1 Tax=Bacillus sp. FJAT-29790 TaxID=1895002 RepID=UPI001C24114A|nr:hypothetical protein [Bacillus sp. FJAT-29790]MBU8878291.1 hypothetical protein [Bacillus sp. FJAT-29790]